MVHARVAMLELPGRDDSHAHNKRKPGAMPTLVVGMLEAGGDPHGHASVDHGTPAQVPNLTPHPSNLIPTATHNPQASVAA